jgi:tetratricopeptide (TPR) repeat protein
VIVPPERIPVTSSAENYLQAVIEFEQTGHTRPANLAYSSAIKKWPENVLAYTGLANSAFALGNYSLSEKVYQQALALSPDSHQLWNNLAYARAKLGKKEASLDAIHKAIALAPDNQNYQESLIELKQLLVAD